ncbi:non-ribosomal peptide synthetase [Plantactinospora soyae]|uniref:Phenyloxazoline synthase MbtB n=1 Tax=Plantactinospora soyae TaxID=1544732 RepID=A0A927QXJ5_9ACTN|nr:non-ribosomal peptide synthetase [Plantactinospora soyae]MBE1485548.1 natural product biosynthesis luciferase-like monooxygenase protein/amino acid adenylation domain-containing protein [Plantactinospora soyae]
MTSPTDRPAGTGLEGQRNRLAKLTPQQRAQFAARIPAGPLRPSGDRQSDGSHPDGPRPGEGGAEPPLSFGQERLWFLEQLYPGAATFNEYVALRLSGPIDVAALETAFDGLVDRQQALRSVVDPADGTPRLRVLPRTEPVLRVIDLPEEAARELAEREAASAFDLEHGPLFRALLIRSDDRNALLVVVNHHLVGDAWSRTVMMGELAARYRAARDGGTVLGPLAVQYADWAAWQRRTLTDEALDADLEYWTRQMAGAPALLALATDRLRPAVPSHRGARVRLTLDADLTDAVAALARDQRATPFMVTLAAWQAVLMRHSGQQDVVVGVPTAGRDRPEVESVAGMFINSLPLRTNLTGDPTFAELLDRVRTTALDAFAHATVPFERLVQRLRPDRDTSHAPIYQVQFGYRNVPAGTLDLPGLSTEPVDLDNGLCRLDLSLELALDGDRTAGVCEYSRDLFDEGTVRAMLDAFVRVLRDGTADSGRRLSDLLVLCEAETAALAPVEDGGPLPDTAEDIVAAFARVVAERPDAPAVVTPGRATLTYRELAARSERVLATLRAAGVGPGDRVGICLRRDADLPATMLAILRCGAAYLPIDSDYPPSRLAYLVGDARPAAVVVHAPTRDRIPALARVVDLDRDLAAVGTTDADAAVDPDSAAYVIYTSGSTGQPKGVVVRRRNLTAFLAAMDLVARDEEPVTWLAVTSVSFDISVLELLWTLSRGHRVVIAPDTLREPAPTAEPAAVRAPEFSLFYFASDASEGSPGPDRYRLLMEGARVADEAGFSAVWLPERHFHAFGGPFPAPAVLAAAVAQATRRVGIRAGSVVAPLHHPARVAEDWAVVDNLSGGRVGLSFASGWHANDFVLAPDAYHDRQRRTAESIDQVRRLWRGEKLPFPGPDGEEVLVGVLPRPVQAELPYWLTSSGNPETCRRAGQIGARLLTHLLGQTVEELAERIDIYRRAWQDAGHPGTGHVTLMVHTFIGADGADVRSVAWQPFRQYLRSSVGLIESTARRLGVDVRAADFTPEDEEALLDHACDRYLRDASLIGTAEDRLPLVQRLAQAGVDEIACLVDFGVPADAALAGLPRLAALHAAAVTAASAAPTVAPPVELTELIRRHSVTHLQCTPSLARALLAEREPGALGDLRQLLLGGEPLDADLVGRLAPHLRGSLHNMYGPTETTVWSTTDVVDPAATPVTIGRPIAGTTLRVVDPYGRRVPVGVPGELLIGGAGVSAGYLGRPEVTRERFVADSSHPAETIYRTGDVVRTRADGRVEYLSRDDHQVKIRGFRIETGEVEAALAGLPGVAQCVVTPYGLGTERAGLAAYLVAEPSGRTPTPAELRDGLAAQLPGYMIPSRFVVLDALPVTANGKVDRSALPVSESAAADVGYVPPATATEERVCAIWREVLRVNRVGTADDFFLLGGHSLLATQVVTAIRREFGVQVPLRILLSTPTVAALAAAVDAGRSTAAGDHHDDMILRPDPAHRHDPFPLTDVQRAYWIGRSGTVGGDVSCHLYLELEGPNLDPDRLSAAWQKLVRRHDALRLVVDDEGRQRILPETPDYQVAVDDLSDLPADERDARLAASRERMSHQVLPADRWPLFELRASRLDPIRTRLHLSVDTLIADGGSVRQLLHELLAVYQGRREGRPLALSFRDYVLADQTRRAGPGYEGDLAYWRDRLDTLPSAPALPLARRAEDLDHTRFRRREAYLSRKTWAALQDRAAAAQITPSVLALTAYATVLGTWSARDRFTINLTLFNRDGDHPDLPELVGDFTALTLLEIASATAGSFLDRAHAVGRQLWEDLEHRLVSGVWVAGELARRRGVTLAAMPVVFTSELGAPGAGGSAAEEILDQLNARVVHTITQTPQVWLDHQIAEDGGRLRLTWDSVDALFPDGLLDDMFGAYVRLLEELAADEAAWRETSRELLPPAHATAFDALNDTAGPIPDGLLHEPFLAQAARTPGHLAVVSATGDVNYGELADASARVAHAVARAGVRPGDVVGVLTNRGWEQVAAVIGVLRAGAVYLPLDTDLPAPRLARSLRHSGAMAVVAPPGTDPESRVPDGLAVVRFADALKTADEPPSQPVATAPGDPAYVIYTSGSTGEPKGVLIDHRGALNTVTDIDGRFGLGPDDRVFGLSALGFDLSVWDVFGTLAAGATLVLAGQGEERDPAAWSRLIDEHDVTVWNSVPALMEMLLAYGRGNPATRLDRLRLVLLSGDWIPVTMPDTIRSAAPKAAVISLGGATEASIWSVLHPIEHVDPERPSIPYGRPMRNQRMVVLNAEFHRRPWWVPGELYIAGVGLAMEYRNAPELTELAFPVHPASGERLYRTGDLARLLPDGNLEFLGREDSQVKVRGMRIELGEVEGALSRAAGVREAAAVVEGTGPAARLVAYVVPDRASGGPAVDGDRLRALDLRLRQPGRRTDLSSAARTSLSVDAGHPAGAAPRGSTAVAFGAGPVAATGLAALLTVLTRQDQDGVPRYGYGSAGGLYPVQTYVAIAPGGVSGLAAGTYYLDPSDASLVAVGADGTDRGPLDPRLFSEANRALVAACGFGVFLIARNTVIEPVYGALSERFCLLEAGAMAQLLRQRSAEVDVALCPIGDVYAPPLREAFGLEENQTVLYTLLAGRPAQPASARRSLPERLQAELAERLPAYLVPQQIREIEALPLSANGKVDRAALRAQSPGPAASPPAAVPVSGTYTAAGEPRRPTIDRLAALWREVMDGLPIDVDANLFESGANSIHLVRAQRRIAEEFGRELPMVEMFAQPTIRHLAELLDASPATAAAPATSTGVTGDPQPDRRAAHRQRRRAARGDSDA